MVESIHASSAVAVPQAAPAIAPRKEMLNPDGSAVPDIIAYYHRPEDLFDDSDQSVPDATDSEFFGADGLTFGDLLDIINPLQHIPVVATIYRALTGDEISPGARLAGGALFGGPIGFSVAIVNAAVEASSGADIGDTIMTALTGNSADEPAQTVATAPATPDAAVPSSGIAPVAVPPQAPQAPPAPLRQRFALPFAGTGLPFGGIGAVPFTAVPSTASDPVAAVLQARSAVPRAGGSSPLPVISTSLSDKLEALAAKTAALPPAKREDDDDDKKKPKRVEPDAAPRPQYAPSGAISQTMLNALDRYRQMKQAENADIPRR